MANNSINGKFRELYKKVEENLTEETKRNLADLYKLGAKGLHSFRKKLFDRLDEEYDIILNALAIENNISAEEIEYRRLGTRAENYGIAIEILNESIRKYKSQEEIDAEEQEWQEFVEHYENDPLTEYFNNVRDEIYDLEDDDEFEENTDNEFASEYSEEERIRDEFVFQIENVLENKLVTVVQNIKKELKITGQVIDFFLDLYDN